MSRYFWIECGLRGAYCDGNGYIAKCDTRRELKSHLQWEADSIRDAGGIGLSKRSIAWLAAKAWKPEHGLPYVVPYRWQYQDSYPYGVHVSQSDRKSYLQYCKEEGI
jgi:hypothetical protein